LKSSVLCDRPPLHQQSVVGEVYFFLGLSSNARTVI
jgi:hypothetical protein